MTVRSVKRNRHELTKDRKALRRKEAHGSLNFFSFLSAVGLRAAMHLFSNFLKFKQIVSQLLCVSKCGLAAHDPVLLASPIHGALSAILIGYSLDMLLLFSHQVMSDSFATLWTHHAPLSMGFPKQEYWSGLPFPSPGDLPYPGSNPHWQADSLPLSHQGNPTWSKFNVDQSHGLS